MKQYNVKGMSCAACSARVEKAVSKVEGVQSCSVSLLTNSMGVEGNASPESIIAAVRNAGYDASPKGAQNQNAEENSLEDTETPKLKKRLIWSVIFLAVLMYVSMGHMMWGWPLPPFFENNHVAMGLVQLLLTSIIMVINQHFFTSGFRALINRSPNMDTLVALGASAAFIYSTYALFAMTGAVLKGDDAAVMSYMHEFYFESAGMILTLITVGKTLESYSKGKTTSALKGLMNLAPKTAVIIKDGKEITVSVDEISVGDEFIVYPGASIPTDGVVISGGGAVDESALTGESVPADKQIGDKVYAATVNQSGNLRCKATSIGEDTTLSQIIGIMNDAAATKAPISRAADKISAIFVPAVILIAVITATVWQIIDGDFGFSLARGISVLVISCPCALGLATPVAIMVANGIGAKNGILFKTAASIEAMGKIDTVVLDKTGTITSGNPRVCNVYTSLGIDEKQLLQYAYSLERLSEHPLSKAIVDYSEKCSITSIEAQNFEAVHGKGVHAVINGKRIRGGNTAFIGEYAAINSDISDCIEKFASEGKTPLIFSEDDKLLGVIAVADTIKPDSKAAVDELHGMGLEVIMLTGDNERTARAVGNAAGVDKIIAEVMPSGKELEVRKLQTGSNVCMVGDGINDAPALTRAAVGVAIGAGTDIAIDAADVVLMKSRLSDVPAAIRLSRAALRSIHENLFWAFIYNTLGIPLAAGVFIAALGWQLNPMFAAAAMSLSSFCVVMNSLRLNLVNIRSPKHDRHIHHKKPKENDTMTKTIKIEGMMCAHCEARVKQALEEIDGVTSADVSHESGTATITLSCDVDNDVLKRAVENQGYKVI